MKKISVWSLTVVALGVAILASVHCGGDKSTGSPCYTLTLQVQGSGHAEAEPGLSCYPDTTHLTLEAEPDPGWTFDDWSGDLTGSNNPITITLSKNSTITANFDQLTYDLTVIINPIAGGTVTRNPDQASYHYGDDVTLNAIPAGGYEFVSWTGDASGSNPTTNITITGDMSVSANFDLSFISENEPDCGTNYVDNFNGGCNSTPPVYSQIANGQAIEGTSGTFLYLGDSYRDTDWYRYVATGNRTLNFKGVADFDLQLYILDITSGCDNVLIVDSHNSSAGDTAYTSATVGAGTYIMWVGPFDYSGWPCPVDYRIWFTASSAAGAKISLPESPADNSIWKASASQDED